MSIGWRQRRQRRRCHRRRGGGSIGRGWIGSDTGGGRRVFDRRSPPLGAEISGDGRRSSVPRRSTDAIADRRLAFEAHAAVDADRAVVREPVAPAADVEVLLHARAVRRSDVVRDVAARRGRAFRDHRCRIAGECLAAPQLRRAPRRDRERDRTDDERPSGARTARGSPSRSPAAACASGRTETPRHSSTRRDRDANEHDGEPAEQHDAGTVGTSRAGGRDRQHPQHGREPERGERSGPTG